MSSTNLSNVCSKDNSIINPQYTFDSLTEYSGNQWAVDVAKKVVAAPGKQYNPLFIYSKTGLGKTHLMHAIRNEILSANPNYKICCVTSEALTNDIVMALRKDRSTALRKRYQKIDMLMVDDIQFLAHKNATQEEFFFIFDELYAKNKQIVMASSTQPKNLGGLMKGLKSRFSMGLLINILPPDFEAKVNIILSKAKQRKIKLTDITARMLASRIKPDMRLIEGALHTIEYLTCIQGKPICLKTIKAIL